jgi:hypothetical protein
VAPANDYSCLKRPPPPLCLALSPNPIQILPSPLPLQQPL